MLYHSMMVKAEIKTDVATVYTNFCGLNMPEDIECESFTVISIGFLLIY